MSEQQQYTVNLSNGEKLLVQGSTALAALLQIKTTSLHTLLAQHAGQPVRRTLKPTHPNYPDQVAVIEKSGPKPKLGAPTGRAPRKHPTKRQLQRQAEQWAGD